VSQLKKLTRIPAAAITESLTAPFTVAADIGDGRNTICIARSSATHCSAERTLKHRNTSIGSFAQKRRGLGMVRSPEEALNFGVYIARSGGEIARQPDLVEIEDSS
jgi:hypothetical protein